MHRLRLGTEYQSRLIEDAGCRQVLKSQIQAPTDPLWASAHWGEVNNSLFCVKRDRWSIRHSQEQKTMAHVEIQQAMI